MTSPDAAERGLAVVGIGCRLPGGIESPDSLWDALLGARDAIVEIPNSRWSDAAFHHPDAAVPGMSYSRWAGLVDEPEMFDAAFFGLTPREAQRLDPQQRWFLESAWRSIEDAGIRVEDLHRRPIGVFLGCSSSDYGDIQRHWRYLADAYTNTGSAVSLIANRVSYAFDLRGPSLVVDTACSSSLVALDIALAAMRDGRCEAAIVGGVNAIFMPESTIGFAKASMLARDGRCKAFDARADGYVRAEGAVALYLKPMDRAIADGDRIYACILSSAVNQDGHTPGITVPNEAQQRAMLETAYAGIVDPAWLGAVEAHGTGTPVGDPIEARALGHALGRGRTRENPLLIGSIKTNIGHLEPASGAAGLAKLALCLYRGRLVPSLHFSQPNPDIDFAALGLSVVTEARDFPEAPDGSRYGGVNSFGFGGTNAHAVLSSAPAPQTSTRTTHGPILWPLSARNPASLDDVLHATRSLVQGLDASSLRRRAVVQARRRSAHAHRLAIVADGMDEFAGKLAAADPAKAVRRVGSGAAKRLFVFAGQGGQWHGMARDLEAVGSQASAMAERAAAVMPPVAGRPVLEALRDPDPEHADRTDVVQPLLFLQQLMLAAQLEAWGITADAVCGHSVGEIAAACWAGALSLEDAAAVVHHRSRLQETTRGSGAMAVIGLSPDRAADRLAPFPDLHIAAVNAPELVTLAGNAASLDRLLRALEEDRIFIHRLPMPYAFHCPHMDALQPALQDALSGLRPSEARLPFYSTVTGQALSGAALGAEYWWRNLREPVRFGDAVSAALGNGCHWVVELGPQPSLLRAATQCAEAIGKPVVALSTLQRRKPAPRVLAETLAQFWTQGGEPDWEKVYPGVCAHEPVPLHTWQREAHWLEAPVMRGYRTLPPSHPMLGRRVHGANARWEQLIDVKLLPDLADHRLRGEVVFPAAAYVEQMLAVGHALFGDSPATITHLELDRMLTLDRPRLVQVEYDESSGRIQVFSEPDSGEQAWMRHAHARLLLSAGALTLPTLPDAAEGTAISIDDLYRRFDRGGNHYGPRFRCVRELHSDGSQAWGRLTLDAASAAQVDHYRLHPALLDAALQMVLELLRIEGKDELYIPLGVDRVDVARAVGASARCLVRNARRGDGILSANIYLYGDDGTPLAVLEGCRCRVLDEGTAAGAATPWFRWGWEPAPREPALIERASFALWGFDPQDRLALQARYGGENVADLAQAAAPVDGALICWFRSRGDDVLAGAQQAVIALADLARRLAGAAVAVHLVTEGATWGQAAQAGVTVDLAALWALGRSLLTERPIAISGMTDLEPGTLLDRALRQIGADLACAAKEVSWRQGERYEHRLRTLPPKQLARRRIAATHAAGYVLAIGEAGRLGGLRWRSKTPTVPGIGQVVIEVAATGVNFRDVLKMLDLYPLEPGEQRLLGDECAGRVVAVGPDVVGIAPGDEVVAIAAGAMASHVLADARLVARRPPALSAAAAAGIPIAFLTAWHALVECGRLQRGEVILIHAAAGGVGQAAIQIALYLGARVLATASPPKHDAVARLGAEAVFNSRDLSFADGVRRATGGAGVDLVLNSLAGDALLHSIELLKPFGRFVELGKRDVFANRALDLRALRDNRSFSTVDLASYFSCWPERAGQALKALLARFEDGTFSPIETHVHAARDAEAVFRAMAKSQHTGKLVLAFDAGAAPGHVEDASPVIVRRDATYLVTGGTSGLGLLVARVLAAWGAGHLVLASRSGRVTSGDEPRLAAIRALGAEVHLRSCDVGDREQTEALLAEIQQSLPPLRGIVHGAMVLKDVDALGVDADNLAVVWRPKVAGAWNLHGATQACALDWFCLQGSIAATLGAGGQANYVVANHMLEALVALRRRAGLPAQLIAWGPIAGAGVVARSDRLQQYFARLGFTPLADSAVEQSLHALLGCDEPSLAAVQVDWRQFAAVFPGFRADDRWSHLLEAQDSGAGDANIGERLRAAEPAERRRLLNELIQEQVAQILGIEHTRIAPDQPLGELGLDSLMAFELSALIESRLGRRLPIAALQGNRSLAELVDALDRAFAPVAAPRPVASHVPLNGIRHAAQPRLHFLAPGRLTDDDLELDAAALTYVPDEFVRRGGLGPDELKAAFGEAPFLSSVITGPAGRVGAFMLPIRGQDLFADPVRTCELIHQAMEIAGSQRSQVVTLTGLIPAATEYGHALKLDNGNGSTQRVTTGHALTTATILANLLDVLQRCGRRLEDEKLAVVGLGSVGRSVLTLLLRTMAHPRCLVLCDLYAKREALAAFSDTLRGAYGFRGPIEIASGDNGLPEAVLNTRLLVSAVDRAGLIEPERLAPGTIVLDDSYPSTFAPESAWQRMEGAGDVVIASGGFARFAEPIEETLYVPDNGQSFLKAYGEKAFLQYFERDANEYTACVFAGPLILKDPSLRASIGIPSPEDLDSYYAALARHRIESARPHCAGRAIAERVFDAARGAH